MAFALGLDKNKYLGPPFPIHEWAVRERLEIFSVGNCRAVPERRESLLTANRPNRLTSTLDECWSCRKPR
jgi:hypothetical protein